MNHSDTLKGNLRFLIASTSSEEVYNTLTQIFKEDYAFLQKLYGKDKLEVPKKVTAVTAVVQQPSIMPNGFPAPVFIFEPPSVPVQAAPVAPSVVPAALVPAALVPAALEPVTKEAPKIRADTKVRIVKKPTAPTDLPPAVLSLSAVPAPVAAQVATPVVHTESGFRDPKDIKKWQKEQEDNKAAELRANGINPVSLLTEANMRKWVVEEKKTFAAIAREYVGLSDSVIASEAKKYGLQSDIAKRRVAVMNAKKAK